MDYVERLTALRVDGDFSQREIAGLLGCQQSAVSKYETRKVPYRVEDVITLCNFYHVSADYVLGLSKNMPYPDR